MTGRQGGVDLRACGADGAGSGRRLRRSLSVTASPPRPAATPIPTPPTTIPTLPTGARTSCRTTGPASTLYGVHAPNGPPRRGDRYLVHAWGISVPARAVTLLRALFPRIPAHPTGTILGAPKGYRCKGRDAPGTVTKSKPHDGSCIRLRPPAMLDWEPVGGTVG